MLSVYQHANSIGVTNDNKSEAGDTLDLQMAKVCKNQN